MNKSNYLKYSNSENRDPNIMAKLPDPQKVSESPGDLIRNSAEELRTILFRIETVRLTLLKDLPFEQRKTRDGIDERSQGLHRRYLFRFGVLRQPRW